MGVPAPPTKWLSGPGLGAARGPGGRAALAEKCFVFFPFFFPFFFFFSKGSFCREAPSCGEDPPARGTAGAAGVPGRRGFRPEPPSEEAGSAHRGREAARWGWGGRPASCAQVWFRGSGGAPRGHFWGAGPPRRVRTGVVGGAAGVGAPSPRFRA